MGMFIHRRKVRQMKAIPQPKVVDSHSDASVEKMEEGVAQISPEDKKSSLTWDDINKLPYFSLKSLASTYGIDVTDKKTKELRKELFAKIKEVNHDS